MRFLAPLAPRTSECYIARAYMQAPSKTGLERLEKGWRLGWPRHSERADLEFWALLGASSTLCTVDVQLGMGR
eukprot:4338524-Pyramimonas_sp.AAC.1